jgi:hypothetical protein
MLATLLKKLVKSEVLFVIFFTTLILTLNIIPMILQTRHSKPDLVFSLVHNNIQDFYFYQSIMNQGANGAWLISDPYTTEPHQTSFIFAYFAWAGKLSRLFSVPYAYLYHFFRFLSGFLLFFFVYRLIKKLAIPYPRLAFLFFVFASPLLHQKVENGITTFVPYMNWWTGMDAIRRSAYLPHHMIGALLLVLILLLLLSFWEKIKLKTFLTMIVLGISMSFIHTPSMLILLMILPPTLFINFFSNQITLKGHNLVIKTHFPKLKKYLLLLAYWLIGLLALLLMVSQTNKGFPWSQYLDWEKNLQFRLESELIGALGILTPFALVGLVKSLISRKFSSILIACWLVIPFLLIPFATKLNISNIRLIQGVPYLPLAILAVMGTDCIIQFLKTLSIKLYLSHNSMHEARNSRQIQDLNFKNSKYLKILRLSSISIFGFRIFQPLVTLNYWLIGLLILLFTINTLPTLKWSMRDQIAEYWYFYRNVYLQKNLFPAFSFINKNYPPKTKTLSTFYTGNYLPAFTNTISFIGHFGYTYNLVEKQTLMEKFLGNIMSEQEAKNFLLNNKINLVFQGSEEKFYYHSYLYPTLLNPDYDKEGITIYSTNY